MAWRFVQQRAESSSKELRSDTEWEADRVFRDIITEPVALRQLSLVMVDSGAIRSFLLGSSHVYPTMKIQMFSFMVPSRG